MWVLVGLGNPGEEYEKTRHNAGRIFVMDFAKRHDFSEWKEDTKLKALVSSGKVGKESVKLVLPNTFMNKSGTSLSPLITSTKKAEQLIVVYDELDVPFGSLRIAFGRGSGGHRGVESIARSIKTKNFVRVRLGVSPVTPGGKLKKPKGEERVLKFLMGDFSKKETALFPKLTKHVAAVLESIVTEGRARAMNQFN